MKYTKMLWLLAVAAAALMAFGGTASATELTSPKGTKVAVGTEMKAEAVGPISLTGTITISCKKVSGEGTITNAGGLGKPVEGVPIFTTFSECGNHTITTVQKGTAILESIGGNTGTMFSDNTEATVLLHSIFLGTIHCTYVSDGTHVGTAIGSGHSTNTTATLSITASISKDPFTSEPACGEHATLEGTAILTSPDHLYID